jgi:hypothetical protein
MLPMADKATAYEQTYLCAKILNEYVARLIAKMDCDVEEKESISYEFHNVMYDAINGLDEITWGGDEKDK